MLLIGYLSTWYHSMDFHSHLSRLKNKQLATMPCSFEQFDDQLLVNKEIFLVEGDEAVRISTARFLRKFGCRVTEIPDEKTALSSLLTVIPDVLLCGVSLESVSGGRLLNVLTTNYPMLPIIALSDHQNMRMVAEGLKRGVQDFLMKPLENPYLLLSSIHAIVKAQDTITAQDFSHQWLDENLYEHEELEWRLNSLESDIPATRDLFMGLLPEPSSRQGDWQITYYLLQSTSSLPLLIDYMWVIEGKLFFYILSVRETNKESILSALLIRTLFHQFLAMETAYRYDISMLWEEIKHHLEMINMTDWVSCIVGEFNISELSLSLLQEGFQGRMKYGDASMTSIDIESQYQNYVFEGQSLNLTFVGPHRTQCSLRLEKKTAE